MSINREHTLATSLCDSLLTVAYFDIANDCVFEFNGYPGGCTDHIRLILIGELFKRNGIILQVLKGKFLLAY